MGIPVEEFDATDGVLPTGVPVTLDVRGKRVVIPTGDEAVQIGRNEWQIEYPVGVTYHPGTILVSGGDNVSIETIDGAESGTVLNHITTGAHGDTLYHDHIVSVRTKIVNGGAGSNVVMVEPFDVVGAWGIIDGTGTLSVSDSKLVVTGTTDENGLLRVRKEVDADFSGSEFICATLNSTLDCRAAHSLVSTTNEIQHFVTWGKLGTYGNRFDIEAGVDTRFVLPIDAPVGSVGSLPSYEIGIFESNLIKWLYVGIAGAEPNSPCTLTIGQITLVDSTPCTIELISPISIPSDGVEYRCPASDPNEVFAVYDPTANELLDDVPSNAVFMDGTALSDFGGSHGFYGIGSGDETVNGVVYGTPATHTYPVAPDCAKFIAFTVDVPPSDDGRTYINEFTFDAVVPYTVFGYPCEGSPWGGAKEFSAPPDNMPGTVRILGGDNCYLMPVDQSVKSKVLHSGYLSEKGALTVDTEAHAMTEEFTIVNEGAGSDVTVIDDCSSVDGWSMSIGTGSLSIEDGRIKVTATVDESGRVLITNSSYNDLASFDFLSIQLRSESTGIFYTKLASATGNEKTWNASRFLAQAGADNKYHLAIRAPYGDTGACPSFVAGTLDLTQCRIYGIGISSLTPYSEVTFYLDSITACNGTWATAEVAVPDELVPTGIGGLYPSHDIKIFAHDGGEYELVAFYNGDSDADGVGGSCYRLRYMDSSRASDLSGEESLNKSTWLAGYNVGTRNDDRAINSTSVYRADQSAPTITYSSTHGAEKRIGFAILMPPSDNDRTGINKVQLKLVTYYDDDGKATIELADDDDLATGLQHMRYPVIIIYDETTSVVDYYVSTGYLNNFKYTQDENGDISSIEIDPGNSIVYHGQTFHSGTSQDGDADGIPDFLEIGQSGSVLNYLKCNDFVRHLYNVYGLNVSIIANDFGITLDDVDIAPFTVSHGNPVYDADMNRLTPVETTDVEGGSVDTYDVKALSEVRVRDLPGNNAGDVVVYDTNGESSEALWTRVTSTDHVFVECVVENGLLRLKVSPSDTHLYAYIDGAYVFIGKYFKDDGITPYKMADFVLTSINSDKITFTIDSNVCVLERGDYVISIDSGSFWWYPSSIVRNLEYDLTNGLIDGAFVVDGTLTISNYYSAILIPGASYIPLYISPNVGIRAWKSNTNDALYYVRQSDITKPIMIGALPISPVYIEADTNTVRVGAVIVEDVDAYGGYAAECTYRNGGIDTLISLRPGEYTVFVRGKPDLGNVIRVWGRLSNGEWFAPVITMNEPGYAIYSTKIVLDEAIDDLYMFIQPESNLRLYIDYALVVPTGELQQAAEPSLVQIDTAKTVLKLPR